MTRSEFDTWIETKYTQLLRVARKRTNSEDDALDALQNAVARALANGHIEAIRDPWLWMVNAVRSTSHNIRRGHERTKTAKVEFTKVVRPSVGGCGWKRPAPAAE